MVGLLHLAPELHVHAGVILLSGVVGLLTGIVLRRRYRRGR